MGHKIRIKTKDGGFGFQVMGGIDSDIPAQVDYIVAGTNIIHYGLMRWYRYISVLL